jgi:hypothetical protein
VADNQPDKHKNRMTPDSPFSAYIAQIRECIQRNSRRDAGATPEATIREADGEFNELAQSLFALQFLQNVPYRKFCESRKVAPHSIQHWSTIPAVPTAGFKEVELTSIPAGQRARVFHSSGATGRTPSRHFHDAESLSLYEASLIAWFREHLLMPADGGSGAGLAGAVLATGAGHPGCPGGQRLRMVILTPTSHDAPNSSLAQMFETIRREFGRPDSVFTGGSEPDGSWSVDRERTVAVLRESVAANCSVLLLGTAFNFIHLLDHLKQLRLPLSLPTGSRALETGGYKGRSRILPKAELHALIIELLGIPPASIVSEYGMSELSSQAYDHAIEGGCRERVFHFPPWARAQIISPETGREAAEGETGLIRVFDLANVRSVMAIQTEDVGVRRGGAFELLGRAALSETRGCSLMSA